MNKFKSKKGFTLAELLIVVAIIAVLVAIAVPLFVSALNKAQDARDDAQLRSIRGTVVVAILNTDAPAKTATSSNIYKQDANTKEWSLEGPWYAHATVSESGEVTIEAINTTQATAWGTVTEESVVEKTGGGFDVYVKVSKIDLSSLHTVS